MAYGHPTPKRQQARSNWSAVSGLDTGSMVAAAMRAHTQFATTSLGLRYVYTSKHMWFYCYVVCN